MGNTTMRSTGVYSVRILEVDVAGRLVRASINCNPPVWTRRYGTWKEKRPVLVKANLFGKMRLANRTELNEMKVKEAARIAAQTAGYAEAIRKSAEEAKTILQDYPERGRDVGNRGPVEQGTVEFPGTERTKAEDDALLMKIIFPSGGPHENTQ
jgi:hypothetical protein